MFLVRSREGSLFSLDETRLCGGVLNSKTAQCVGQQLSCDDGDAKDASNSSGHRNEANAALHQVGLVAGCVHGGYIKVSLIIASIDQFRNLKFSGIPDGWS